jgi:hypothetical protein
MSGTLIEVAVLGMDPAEDRRTAIERLAAVGPIVFLRGLRADHYSVIASTTDPIASGLVAEVMAGEADEVAEDAGARADPRATARLESIRAEYGAEWLIAIDASVASARACPGLRIICLGPAGNQPDPTRPDHRAHSLLEAARLIEAAAAFA